MVPVMRVESCPDLRESCPRKLIGEQLFLLGLHPDLVILFIMEKWSFLDIYWNDATSFHNWMIFQSLNLDLLCPILDQLLDLYISKLSFQKRKHFCRLNGHPSGRPIDTATWSIEQLYTAIKLLLLGLVIHHWKLKGTIFL